MSERKGKLPTEYSLHDVKVQIKKTVRNPNIGNVTQAVLKEGPRAFKIATLLEVINPNTQGFHHYSLRIDHIDHTKEAWFARPKKSVLLEGKDPDEIEKLYRFLHAVHENKLSGQSGDLHLISSIDYAKLENVLDAIDNIAAPDKLQIIKTLLSQLDGKSSCLSDFVGAFAKSNGETLKHIAAASRMVEYTHALEELKELVADPSITEPRFQKHLNANPWMFGSEYSELLSRQSWTRDANLDYMLRKTSDGYVEIAEIKRAFPDDLFMYDTSHKCYYPSSKLTPVIGQVIDYIEDVERHRDSILANDGVDTLKIRVKVIIGRDGIMEHQATLRNLNSHLHRIEIITYDQLIKIAERVLSMFDVSTEDQEVKNDDAPF